MVTRDELANKLNNLLAVQSSQITR